MNLYPEAFELIENGNKKVEMRLNDEKRQKVTIGDLIIFTNTKTKPHRSSVPCSCPLFYLVCSC
jgi:ASC-1-like (ASCH) protein